MDDMGYVQGTVPRDVFFVSGEEFEEEGIHGVDPGKSDCTGVYDTV